MLPSRFFATRKLAPLLLAIILLIEAALLQTPVLAEDRTLLLAVELNGRPIDAMVEVEERGGTVSLPADDLAAIGLRKVETAGDRVTLGDLPGLHYRIDERRQMLVIQAEDASLLAQKLQPDAGSALPVQRPGMGAVLNYNVLGTGGTAGGEVNGLFELRGYSPYGVLSGSALVQRDFGANSGTSTRGTSVIRLDTVLADTEFDSMRRWRLGDVISGGLSWSRPFRLGGFQLTSDFSIRPDLVTFPLPNLGGSAGLPSTVDILVNGVRQLSQQVQPGPFELRQAPVVTGAGDIAVVVRDATGRETVRNLSFYASPLMLKPGLWSYGVEGGLVRTGYGLTSNGYQKPAITGTVRHGVTSWLTAEGHLEAASQVQTGGGGVAVDLAGHALLSASATGSVAGRRNGTQFSGGIERAGRVVSLSASFTQATRGFRDVLAFNGAPVPTRSMQAGFGLSLGRWGSLHAAYVAIDRSLLIGPSGNISTQSARVASASYGKPVTETVSFYATGYRDLSAHGSTGINIGFSMALGPRRSINASADMTDGQPSGFLDATQAAVVPGDIGWHVLAAEGRTRQQQAESSFIMPWGTATVGAEHVGANYNGRAGLQGSLVLAGGDLFAANRVDDSFAVVDTDGLAGVDVMRENRVVGRTNADGRLLIPDLRGWEPNRISIDPSAMPGDVELGSLNQVVRPPDHTGIPVRFAARRGNSAVVRLVDSARQPLPTGSQARLMRTGHRMPVGYGGEIFATDLKAENTLDVTTSAGRCTAHFSFAPKPGDIPVIGPIPCERNAP